ncbi:hypothetical protein DFJ73DRAFT_827144 [Zopfochytrium polystomum]|nr:hypothetical protein DFJ73DRAFT_827144 [Zopfochytrium polystomum]
MLLPPGDVGDGCDSPSQQPLQPQSIPLQLACQGFDLHTASCFDDIVYWAAPLPQVNLSDADQNTRMPSARTLVDSLSATAFTSTEIKSEFASAGLNANPVPAIALNYVDVPYRSEIDFPGRERVQLIQPQKLDSIETTTVLHSSTVVNLNLINVVKIILPQESKKGEALGDHWVRKEVYEEEMRKRALDAVTALSTAERPTTVKESQSHCETSLVDPRFQESGKSLPAVRDGFDAPASPQKRVPHSNPIATLPTSTESEVVASQPIQPQTPKPSESKSKARQQLENFTHEPKTLLLPTSASSKPSSAPLGGAPSENTRKIEDIHGPPSKVIVPPASDKKHKPPERFSAPQRSDATLEDAIVCESSDAPAWKSVEDILGETKPGWPSGGSSGNEQKEAEAEKAEEDVVEAAEAARGRNKVWETAFRWFNLARSVATAVYSIHSCSIGLYDPYYVALNAQGLMVAMIFFSFVDVIVSFIKAFPKMFWCFWNVRNWDPFRKSYSIWAIVADHDLIVDLLPLLVNTVLKVYSYRLAEVVANPAAQDSITTAKWTWADLSSPQYHNFVQLLLYASSMLYTILFHTGRIIKLIAFEKKAYVIGLYVLLKALLVIWDIFTNGLLLYESLVADGIGLCRPSPNTRLILAVIALSPAVTLSTNVLINLPLHVAFLRFQLRARDSNASVPFLRVLKAAAKKTFHPLISAVFGSYAVFSLVSLFYVQSVLSHYDPWGDIKKGKIPAGVIPTSGFFGWSTRKDGDLENGVGPIVLLGMVWLNIVANYLVGAAAAVAYWAWVLVWNVLGGERGVAWLKKRLRGGMQSSQVV